MSSDLQIDLIVGLSRPQIIKKVLQYGSMLRVRSIALFPTALGEKSYRTSKVLLPENIDKEVQAGVMQIESDSPPSITLYDKFYEFIETLKSEDESLRILAEPKSEIVLKDIYQNLSPKNGIKLAIGPEPGWSEDELRVFRELHFQSIKISDDHLRVEVALVAFISQLRALL